MSIRDYLAGDPDELKIREKGEPPFGVEGDVLEGKLSVEEAHEREKRKARRKGETYGSVGAYDPVLRSHCRLDREG